MPDGTVNIRRCKKNVEDLRLVEEFWRRLLGAVTQITPVKLVVPSVPNAIPNVIPSVIPNVIPSVPGESDMRRELAGEVTMRIERPCDYCQQHSKLQKIGKKCSECEKKKDMDYCMNEWIL